MESKGTVRVKRGFARMQKHGVIMDVTNVEQAQIAEEAGAVAVMALDKLPVEIRAAGGVARMCDVNRIQDILDHVTIPVMAKCRIGHVGEARILEAIGVDMIDESEVLTPADYEDHINKHDFVVPFVNGCRNLGEALRRINEGAAMLRTKGEPGTGDVSEAVKHLKLMNRQVRELASSDESQKAEEYKVPVELVREVKKLGRLPVVNFAAGGIVTPADASLMMLLGCDGIFVGSGVFKSLDPKQRAEAIVLACTYFDDPQTLTEISKWTDETKSMRGVNANLLAEGEKMQERSK